MLLFTHTVPVLREGREGFLLVASHWLCWRFFFCRRRLDPTSPMGCTPMVSRMVALLPPSPLCLQWTPHCLDTNGRSGGGTCAGVATSLPKDPGGLDLEGGSGGGGTKAAMAWSGGRTFSRRRRLDHHGLLALPCPALPCRALPCLALLCSALAALCSLILIVARCAALCSLRLWSMHSFRFLLSVHVKCLESTRWHH